jgi:catalase
MVNLGTGWKEVYLHGSQFAEDQLIRRYETEIQNIQRRNKVESQDHSMKRAFHAKIHTGIDNAVFHILPTVPKELNLGLFQHEKAFRAIVRFSNASGIVQPDTAKDLRGVAIRRERSS